jgi:hypothetical protein
MWLQQIKQETTIELLKVVIIQNKLSWQNVMHKDAAISKTLTL